MKTLYLTKFLPYIAIAVVSIVSTLVLWLPFILKSETVIGIRVPENNFDMVIRHWDGPLYIIPAKTWYSISDPVLRDNVLGLPPKYFAAHLPGYPLTIRALQPLVGYPKAPLLSTLLSSVGLFWFFFFLLKKFRLTGAPLLLTFVFMFVTPRFFVIRSIGSPEPLFMLTTLVSLYFFSDKMGICQQ